MSCKDRRSLERREGEEQQEGRHELGPDEEGQAEEGEPGRPELDRGHDEVDRPEERRGDEEHHAEEPPRLPARRDVGERSVGGPARLGRAAGDEEARQHHDAAREVAPVARHVEAGEGHVRGADLEGQHEVAEAAHGERHHPEEHHDRAVHGAELVVELRQHHAARHPRLPEQAPEERQRASRVRQLPPHQHHQAEAEEQEQQPGDRVLDPDRLVVEREDVLPEESLRLVVSLVFGRVRRGDRRLSHGATSRAP